MTIIVQKFGGTSVATTDRIKAVAQMVYNTIQNGAKPIIVVSAMAGVTNNLVSMCLDVSSLNEGSKGLAEYDVALSSGEIVTAALLALSLQKLGIKAQSLGGWQVPIHTNNEHSKALITHVDTEQINQMIAHDTVPIIAGFQGATDSHRIATLGRGGSDTTAVAVAAAINAARCEIYTDTDGVHTTDPRLVDDAQLIPKLNYDEMLEFANLGAKILHPRAVQIAKKYNIPIQIISSFTHNAGTVITDKIVSKMEQAHITGIAHNSDLALCKLRCPTQQNYIDFIHKLTKHNIQIHHLQQTQVDSEFIISFSTTLLQLKEVQDIAAAHQLEAIKYITNITQIAIVGVGLNNDNTLLKHMLTALDEHHLEPYAIDTSTTSISCTIDNTDYEKIIKYLHDHLIQQ